MQLKKPTGEWKTIKRREKVVNRPKLTNPEKVVQGMAEEYLATRYNSRPIRLPDSLLRIFFTSHAIPAHQKKIVSGYLKGLPDLIIPRRIGSHTVILPLEIKTEVGKVTKEQLDWGEVLGTKVAYGWDDVKKTIDEFFAQKLTIKKE